VDRTLINIKFFGSYSNCQTSILTNKSPHTVDVCASSHRKGTYFLHLTEKGRFCFISQKRGVQIAVHLPPFLAHLQSLCATKILEHAIQNHY
jgi:hypothetical protein